MVFTLKSVTLVKVADNVLQIGDVAEIEAENYL
jgi:hypothetical protein